MNFNQLTNKVGQYIQSADGKKCLVQEHLDWNAIKRAPQMLKQKTNVGKHTIDDEFDQMKDKFTFIEKRLLSFTKHISVFSETHISLIDDCKLIGSFAKELFDPYNSLPKSTVDKLGSSFDRGSSPHVTMFSSMSKQLVFEEEYYLWEHMELYLKYMKQTQPAIRKELEQLVDTIDFKVQELSTLIKNVNKRLKERNYCLLDYDKIVNSHNSLLIKQKTKELSIHEAKQVYSLERKLDDAKNEYDKINNLLKKELPAFFFLVEIMFQPIQIMIYYIQLTVYYQIHLNLVPISKAFNINPKELKDINFHSNLVKKFFLNNSQATDLINELTIFKYSEGSQNKWELKDHENTFTQAETKFCEVLFHFTAVEPGDISIKKGDVIQILEQEGNWWRGKLGDKTGNFPGNYVKILTPT